MPRARHRHRRVNHQKPLTQNAKAFERTQVVIQTRIVNPASDSQSNFRKMDINIRWQQPIDQNAGNQLGFDSGGANENRFLQTRDSWQDYAITGVRIEWMPTGTVAMHGDYRDVQITNIWMWSDPKFLPGSQSEGDILQKSNLQVQNPKRQWHQYINFRNFSASQNVPW